MSNYFKFGCGIEVLSVCDNVDFSHISAFKVWPCVVVFFSEVLE